MSVRVEIKGSMMRPVTLLKLSSVTRSVGSAIATFSALKCVESGSTQYLRASSSGTSFTLSSTVSGFKSSVSREAYGIESCLLKTTARSFSVIAPDFSRMSPMRPLPLFFWTSTALFSWSRVSRPSWISISPIWMYFRLRDLLAGTANFFHRLGHLLLDGRRHGRTRALPEELLLAPQQAGLLVFDGVEPVGQPAQFLVLKRVHHPVQLRVPAAKGGRGAVGADTLVALHDVRGDEDDQLAVARAGVGVLERVAAQRQ